MWYFNDWGKNISSIAKGRRIFGTKNMSLEVLINKLQMY